MQVSAPGKIILLGEHAVVYKQPAIAIPVSQLRATATISPGQGLKISAADIEKTLPVEVHEQDVDDALIAVARKTLDLIGRSNPPDATITLRSDIPIASGLGSGAAVSTALSRAIMMACDSYLNDSQLNDLIFEIEKLYHEFPSGIDNTVVVYEKPIYFTRDEPIQDIQVGRPFTFIIADTGKAAPTKAAVADVRKLLESNPDHFQPIIESIGFVVKNAREAMTGGDYQAFGSWMNHNHLLLQELTVSSPELDQLVDAARAAGAFGAKLSGGGRGGNMIALVERSDVDRIRKCLINAGAVQVTVTTLE